MSSARWCFAWLESLSTEAWIVFLVTLAMVALAVDRWAARGTGQ